MTDIARLRKRIDNRHDRIVTDITRQQADVKKLFIEIEERGKIIDTLATRNEELETGVEYYSDSRNH